MIGVAAKCFLQFLLQMNEHFDLLLKISFSLGVLLILMSMRANFTKLATLQS